MAYSDDNLTVLPLTCHEDGRTVYSYIGVPVQAPGALLPKEAQKLGCNPKEHFTILKDGGDVTLKDKMAPWLHLPK